MLTGLILTATALAQLLSATVVAVAATDLPEVTVLSNVATVLASDDPPPPLQG